MLSSTPHHFHIVSVALMTIRSDAQSQITNFPYVSMDGGSTWATAAMPNPAGREQGDDAVVIDHEGTVIRTWLGYAHLRDPRGITPRTGLFAGSSQDGGFTWSDPVPPVDHLTTIVPFTE